MTIEELEEISLNIFENNIIYDVSDVIRQDENMSDATSDTDKDIDGIEMALRLADFEHFVFCCLTCFINLVIQ